MKSKSITTAFLCDFTIDCLSVLIPSGLLRVRADLLAIPKPAKAPLPLALALCDLVYDEMPVSPVWICRVQPFTPLRSLLRYSLSNEAVHPLYPISYFIRFQITYLRVTYCYLVDALCLPPTFTATHKCQNIKSVKSRI